MAPTGCRSATARSLQRWVDWRDGALPRRPGWRRRSALPMISRSCRRPLRRVLGQRTAHNVLAELPARDPGDRVLVIHAHHDAARTGIVFHPG